MLDQYTCRKNKGNASHYIVNNKMQLLNSMALSVNTFKTNRDQIKQHEQCVIENWWMNLESQGISL